MHVKNEVKVLYRALMLRNRLEAFESKIDAWDVWKGHVISDLSGDDKLSYYEAKDQYDKSLLGIVKFIKDFAHRYECLPVLKCNGEDVTVGFTGKHAKGWVDVNLDNVKWLQDILAGIKIIKQISVFEV